MPNLNSTELFIIKRICHTHNVPNILARELLKESKRNTYENKIEKERVRNYRDLMNYHFSKEN